MKLGISGQTLGEVADFESIVDIALKYGIRQLELWPCNVPGTGYGYRTRNIGMIRDVIKRKQVEICCVTMEAAFCEDAVESPELYIDLLKSAIDAAVEVGAPLVNHYCYYINREEKPDFARMEAFWKEPLAYAKKKDVTLVLENEAHDATRRPELMVAILEHFGDKAFATNYDAVNYFQAGAESFPAAYEILRPYIRYVHLKNGCMHRPGAMQPKENKGMPMSGIYSGYHIQYMPIPDGSVNIAGVLTALKENKLYEGVCTLEPHTVPKFAEVFYKREVEWLRQFNFFMEEEKNVGSDCKETG